VKFFVVSFSSFGVCFNLSKITIFVNPLRFCFKEISIDFDNSNMDTKELAAKRRKVYFDSIRESPEEFQYDLECDLEDLGFCGVPDADDRCFHDPEPEQCMEDGRGVGVVLRELVAEPDYSSGDFDMAVQSVDTRLGYGWRSVQNPAMLRRYIDAYREIRSKLTDVQKDAENALRRTRPWEDLMWTAITWVGDCPDAVPGLGPASYKT
jgi:hypothetical protein